MKVYMVLRNGRWVTESRTSPPKEEHHELDAEFPHAEAYLVMHDDDGTESCLMCERKWADVQNEIARQRLEDKRGNK